MSFINRAEVSVTGVLGDSVALPAESAGVLGAISYVSAATGAISATPTDPVDATEGAYVDAFRFNDFGQMFIWNFDSRGLPPGGVFYTGGLPFTKDGQLVVTAQPVAWYVGGWPIALNNYVTGVPTGGGSLPGAFIFTATQGGSPETPAVVLDWTAATGTSVYEVRRNGVLIATVNAPDLVYEDFGVYANTGQTWSYTMSATNGTGTTQSSSNPQLFNTFTVPATMAAPVATAGNASASIAFVPPANGNSAITLYYIRSLQAGNLSVAQTTAGPSPYVFTGLTNGLPYTFQIAAANVVGLGSFSPFSNQVTPAATVTAPSLTVPFLSTLKPSVGSSAVSFTRVAATYQIDFKNILRNYGNSIANFTGARGVQNLKIGRAHV